LRLDCLVRGSLCARAIFEEIEDWRIYRHAAESIVYPDVESHSPMELRYSTRPIPEDERGTEPHHEKSPTHWLKVWLEAPPQILNDIQNVTYHFGPTFDPPDISLSARDKKFIHHTTIWWEFPLSATVYFKNGLIRELSTFVLFVPRAPSTKPSF
jgi:hypothetical protein